MIIGNKYEILIFLIALEIFEILTLVHWAGLF